MAASKSAQSADTSENLFKNALPEAVYTVEGEAVTGHFVRLAKGIPHPEYGASPVMIFTYESGKFADREGTIDVGVVGQEYSLYLLSQVVKDAVKNEQPKVGERIAFRDDGKRASASRKDAKGEAVEYNVIRFSCPDRPTESEEVSFSDL